MTNTADKIKFDNVMKALAEGAYKVCRVQFFAPYKLVMTLHLNFIYKGVIKFSGP